MAGKIFYRERIKVGEKEKKPRFKLEEIAASVGADLVLIKAPKDGSLKDEEIEVK